jgi:hypothetical protein
MPRFLDFAPASLGFRANVVAVLEDGGGVTAGSLESRPKVFLVKEVVAMIGALIGLARFGRVEGVIWLPSILPSRSRLREQHFPSA